MANENTKVLFEHNDPVNGVQIRIDRTTETEGEYALRIAREEYRNVSRVAQRFADKKRTVAGKILMPQSLVNVSSAAAKDVSKLCDVIESRAGDMKDKIVTTRVYVESPAAFLNTKRVA